MYNVPMSDFRFYYPIVVRYGDLDPQGHVNNAAFLTYLEHARVAYIRQLGLWDGESFFEIGIILARIELDYKKPILITDQVEIGLRTSRLGNKSLDMEYVVRNAENGTVYAESKTVQVAYDYSQGKTVPISEEWRKTLSEFEGLS
jgi:acyl-CoA thioester hydrolase